MEIGIAETDLEELTSDEEDKLLTVIKQNLNRDYRLRVSNRGQFNTLIRLEGQNIDMTYDEASRLCTLLKWERHYSKQTIADRNPNSFLEPLRDYFHNKSMSYPDGKIDEAEQEIIGSLIIRAQSRYKKES